MLFATPIWLLALIPWAALALWMLWGRRERVGVPFLALWRDGDVRPSASRAVHAPPIAIVLLLLAILLGIVAASSPALSSGRTGSLMVLVDRGVTMSARHGDAYRYERAAALLAPHVTGPVQVVAVPSREARSTEGGNGLVDAVRSLPPTAVDTSPDVAQAALRLLATSDDPVVILTDNPVPVHEPRLVAVAPPPPATANAGIAHLAARERPAAQVMVRLEASNPSTLAVVVSSDGQRVERTVDAPSTAFIDVPRLGRTVEVALAQGDALAADDRAWLVREAGWPRIETMATLPPELARMVETYRKLRPSRDDGRVVSIVDKADEAAGEAVILAPASSSASGAANVISHPVTANVAWPEVLADARVGERAPVGFAPVVSVGDGVAVAVRENPRQVWVALDAAAFPRRHDYVLFWTNVFDWLGQGGDGFVAHPIGLLGQGWRRLTEGPAGTEPGLWPGIYERGDGTLRAVNVGEHVSRTIPDITRDWQPPLARLLAERRTGQALSPYLLLAALVCALGAALCWPARKAVST